MSTITLRCNDFGQKLRHLRAAVLFLTDDLEAQDDGKDYHNPETRADLAGMISDLADEIVNLYEAEQDALLQGESAETGEVSPP
jgi:hypothetical protein